MKQHKQQEIPLNRTNRIPNQNKFQIITKCPIQLRYERKIIKAAEGLYSQSR